MRTQFTFYVSFYQAISRIKDPAARASAYDMICAYALYQQEPDLDSVPDSVAVAFDLLRPILDKARAKSENGNKGGSKPEANRKQTKFRREQTGKPRKQERGGERERERGRGIVRDRERDRVRGRERVAERGRPSRRPIPQRKRTISALSILPCSENQALLLDCLQAG